jgi:hypothetical protein
MGVRVMSVISVYSSRVNPGRQLDSIALASEAAKLIERHGGQQSRLIAAATAGEQIGGQIFFTEFDSMHAYGLFSDAMVRDPEVDALVGRISAADSPVVPLAQQLCAEIPLGRTSRAGRGAVLEAYLSRPLPGRFQASLDLARRSFDLFEAHGAVNARLLSLVHAGSQTGVTVAVWEFESFAAYGAAADAIASDPAGQAIVDEMGDETWPVTVLSSGLYMDIPL